MARPRALRRIRIPLRERFVVDVAVWRSVADLRLGSRVTGDDYEAVFVEEPEGRCVGTLHVERDTRPELVAHEVQHAMDYFNYRVTTERKARLTEKCVATIATLIEEL